LESGVLTNIVLQVDIDLITTVIGGAIIGAFATFCFAYLIENIRNRNERRKEKEFRENMASIVAHELHMYDGLLDAHLRKFRQVPSNDVIQRSEFRSTFVSEFYKLPKFYITMVADTKSKVFDKRTLMTLERVYQHIQRFNPDPEVDAEAWHFEGRIVALIIDIRAGSESVQKMINRFSFDNY
jgi:hypothetical protein